MGGQNDWETGKQGSENPVFDRLASWLDEVEGSNIHSVLVVRHRTRVFEHYRTGSDERWGAAIPHIEHGVAVKHDLRSATKIVTGLLVGKAIDAGLLPSIDAPIFQYLPEHADLRSPAKDMITIRHLLTMSAGLAWDENVPMTDPSHGERRLWRSADPVRAALDPPMVAEPGTVWNYSGGCTELLAAILETVVGRPIDAYAREVLFEPLGIEDYEWARLQNNAPSASGGLRLRSRDIAKLGQVVLGRGHFGDTAVLSDAWIREAVAPQIGAPDRLFFFGYHWWLGRSLVARKEIQWAAGIGLGGQRLFVIPALDMVAVITAGHYGDAMQAWLPLAILNRFILASAE